MCSMAGDQNAFGTKISPIERQVEKIDAPILGFLLDGGLKTEAIRPTRFAREKALMIRSLMIVGNLTVDREKEQKERRMNQWRRGCVGHRNRQSQDHRLHFG